MIVYFLYFFIFFIIVYAIYYIFWMYCIFYLYHLSIFYILSQSYFQSKVKRKDLLIIPIPIETIKSNLKSLDSHLNC